MRPGARPRILVVDDVPLFREVEALYLSRVGDVRTAASAADARALLGRERFDVVVLDLHLQDEAGDVLCREITGAQPAHEIRWLFVTRGDADDHARAIAAGAADVLTKPLARSELVSAVARLMGEPRGLPRAALREPAHFRARGRTSTGTVQNVSRGGAFVAAGWLPREGTDVLVEFALPGEARAIAAPARVVWRREVDAGAGFGLRFVGLDGSAQRAIGKYVDEHCALPPPHPLAS
ncbi:MAG TPA: response regulator [Myxococcota bacterium]|nr:response regulator [Myxococcota bacterium]